MKLLDNVLYMELAEMVDCGVSEKYLWKAKSVGTQCWSFIKDPEDGRKVLIEYEKLKDDYKRKVKARFGDPYEYVMRMPIRSLVKWDNQAEEFFLAYRYNTNKPLPIEHVKKYTQAASWLNMFKQATADKKALKKQLNLSIEQFYTQAIDLIKTEKIDLPTSYRRLLATREQYESQGYASLIDWRFGNKLAAKINDEVSESTLLEMIAHHNQFDDVFIAQQYNLWATKNNYKHIDPATVGVWRRKKESLIVMYREGNAELKNRFLPQAKGFRPGVMQLTESDDNHLDLLFIDPNDDTPHKYYHRYKAIVVTDSFNDFVLGYAYGEKLGPDLVRAAWLNAMYYIRSITGSWYLPHEVKTDRWALENLRPFYKGIGNYFDTPVSSKNRGYLENFFGSPHWKRCLKIGANNYTGNNMTAKFRGVNQDVLARNKKEYPLVGKEADTQVENFFHRLRHMPQSTGISKYDQWLAAFNELPTTERRMINDEQFLLKFGIKHDGSGGGIRITNRGVEPQINGVRYSYDLDVPSLMEYVGKSVSVVYDPFDMSRVLVTDFEGVRIMGREARLNPRALHNTTVDSRTYLNAVLQEKRNDVDYVAGQAEKRKRVLTAAGVDAETLLTAGVMVKEIKQQAELRMLPEGMIGNISEDDIYEQM